MKSIHTRENMLHKIIKLMIPVTNQLKVRISIIIGPITIVCIIKGKSIFKAYGSHNANYI